MSFQKEENNARNSEYQKRTSDEQSIHALNDVLSRFENGQDFPKGSFPWVFVTGLPRSGTTLLMQVLATCFDLGFVNNFIARLWNTPITGARLSKILFGNERFASEFSSDHGKTSNIKDAHEWSYYWIDRLNYDRSVAFDRHKNEGLIDWEKLKQELDQMSGVFQKPLLFKGLHPAKYISKLKELNPNLFFIHIKRDFVDNCNSVKEAREKYFGEANKWWSIIPDNFAEIKDLSYEKQIPEQLMSIEGEINNDLEKYLPNSHLIIEYKDLCQDPHGVLNSVKENFEKRFSNSFDFELNNIPDYFSMKNRKEYDGKMSDYIKSTFNPTSF